MAPPETQLTRDLAAVALEYIAIHEDGQDARLRQSERTVELLWKEIARLKSKEARRTNDHVTSRRIVRRLLDAVEPAADGNRAASREMDSGGAAGRGEAGESGGLA